jgi:hypothetical protein
MKMQGNIATEKEAIALLDAKGRNGRAIVREAKGNIGAVFHDGARVKMERDGSWSVGFRARV